MSNAGFDFFEDDETAHAAELTQRTLIDTQQRMGMMLDFMPMGLLIHTRQGIIFANQEACRQLHITPQQAIGHHFLDFVDPAEVPPVMEQIDRSFNDANAPMQTRETKLAHRDGELYIKLISCRLPWQGNPVVQILLQDVTDLKHTEQKLRRMAITDELTGAYNRRHAFYEGALYVDPDEGSPVELSAILLDVDHFKRVNDTFGHQVGDQALIAISKAANRLVGKECGDSAMFARIGGEEFLVLLPGIDERRALEIAERLRKAIEKQEISTPYGALRVTVSMGVGSYREADKTFDGLISRCDRALYDAKDNGRNRVSRAT